MIVAYTWKLNTGLDHDPKSLMRFIEVEELPRLTHNLVDYQRIQKDYPYGLHRARAAQQITRGDYARVHHEWAEAVVCYQRAILALERFRHPDVLKTTAECHLRSAICALANGRPGRASSDLKQYTLLEDATSELIELKQKTKELDTYSLSYMTNLLTSQDLNWDQVVWAVDFAIDNPIPKRIELATQVVKHFRANRTETPEILLQLGRCYMAQGCYEDACSLVRPAAEEHSDVRQHLDRWNRLFSRGAERAPSAFGPAPDGSELDAIDSVNRAFTYFVNALYDGAREWLLFALEMAPNDAFGLFGHGLYLWRTGWISLAAQQLRRAQNALAAYPEKFRLLAFTRVDETCEPRSYNWNPIYPIFNIDDCLARVSAREPFVSYAVLP